MPSDSLTIPYQLPTNNYVTPTFLKTTLAMVMSSPSRLDSLLVTHGVAREDSDKQIGDKDIDKISQSCGFPYGRLSSYLGMKQVCAQDAKQDGKSEPDRRAGLLEGWKQLKGSDATYRALIAALLEMERRDDAEVICKLLKESKLTAPATPVHTQMDSVPCAAPSGKHGLNHMGVLHPPAPPPPPPPPHTHTHTHTPTTACHPRVKSNCMAYALLVTTTLISCMFEGEIHLSVLSLQLGHSDLHCQFHTTTCLILSCFQKSWPKSACCNKSSLSGLWCLPIKKTATKPSKLITCSTDLYYAGRQA